LHPEKRHESSVLLSSPDNAGEGCEWAPCSIWSHHKNGRKMGHGIAETRWRERAGRSALVLAAATFLAAAASTLAAFGEPFRDGGSAQTSRVAERVLADVPAATAARQSSPRDTSSISLLGGPGTSTGALAICGFAFVGLVIRRRRQLSGAQSSGNRSRSGTRSEDRSHKDQPSHDPAVSRASASA
jgi:hypothetical protein